MTLDEAIKHAEEVAEDAKLISMKFGTDHIAEAAKKCANEHRQLAEWLRELKRFRKSAPKGEWEIFAQGWHAIRRCSNCKWTQSYSDSKYIGYKYNFCPNCGADMKGEQNE